jgi:ABC-type iron transport system FetAB ATPase subunit
MTIKNGAAELISAKHGLRQTLQAAASSSTLTVASDDVSYCVQRRILQADMIMNNLRVPKESADAYSGLRGHNVSHCHTDIPLRELQLM